MKSVMQSSGCRESKTHSMCGDMLTALAYKERLFFFFLKRTGRLPFICFGSLLDSAERNRQLCCNGKKCNGKKIKWRCRGSNQSLSHAKRTLYHWATSPSWKIGLLKHIYLLSHTTSLLWQGRNEVNTCKNFYQTLLLWKVSWLAQYKI